MSCSCSECNNDWGRKCLYERIAALGAERDNYKALCDAFTNLEKLGDMTRLTKRLEQAERELAGARSLLLILHGLIARSDGSYSVGDEAQIAAERAAIDAARRTR